MTNCRLVRRSYFRSIGHDTGPQSAIQLVKVSLWVAARFGGSGQALSIETINEQADGGGPGWQVAGAPGSENLSFEHELTPATTVSYKFVLWCGPLTWDSD